MMMGVEGDGGRRKLPNRCGRDAGETCSTLSWSERRKVLAPTTYSSSLPTISPHYITTEDDGPLSSFSSFSFVFALPLRDLSDRFN